MLRHRGAAAFLLHHRVDQLDGLRHLVRLVEEFVGAEPNGKLLVFGVRIVGDDDFACARREVVLLESS